MTRCCSKTIITFWANFAKYGDPNGVGNDVAEVWPEYRGPDWKYLKLTDGGEEDGDAELQVEEDLRGRVCEFWDHILPRFMPDVTGPGASTPRRRAGRTGDPGCRAVQSRARLYFPGYRPIHRLK